MTTHGDRRPACRLDHDAKPSEVSGPGKSGLVGYCKEKAHRQTQVGNPVDQENRALNDIEKYFRMCPRFVPYNR